MKFIQLIPPAVALLIVGAVVGYERSGAGRFEAENGFLQKYAAAAIRVEDTPEVLFPKSDHSRIVKSGISGGKCDWVAVAALVQGQMDNDVDARAWSEFQEQVAGMNEEELLAASEEILALDVPIVTRKILLGKFASRLAGMNSELALRRLFGRTGTDVIFTQAWETWLKKDTVAASAWFDEQIAAGKTEGKRLDGSDASRTEFEWKLISELFESDPVAAVKRLEKLPRESLVAVGGTFRLSGIDEAAQKTLADVYRSQLSEKESAEKLAGGMLGWEDNDDFSKDAAYLKRITVTPAERAVCLKQVMENRSVTWTECGTMTIARIEALRTWMNGQSPELTENLTEKVIGVLARNDEQSKMSPKQVEEIVAHYQALEGGDEMLANALSQCVGGRYRKEFVASLVARLPDGQQRAKVLKKLENK